MLIASHLAIVKAPKQANQYKNTPKCHFFDYKNEFKMKIHSIKSNKLHIFCDPQLTKKIAFSHLFYELVQLFEKTADYFPIQKLENIFPSKSSVVISPVISPSSRRLWRMSIAMKSWLIPTFKPLRTRTSASSARRRAS